MCIDNLCGSQNKIKNPVAQEVRTLYEKRQVIRGVKSSHQISLQTG